MAAGVSDAVIKEGFLCPVCHKDLRSPNNLLAHFQELHSEEQDILKSLKDLVGKAKKRILKLDEQDLELFKTEISLQKYYIEYSEPQKPGQSQKHTEYFKSVRRDRLDHRTTETNKLIIRLDRLLRLDHADRKQHEQELVAWIDGTDVSRCPSCAASFNITRRQHHCRLCGSVMCNSCSFFLPYNVAHTIVAPVYSDITNQVRTESETLRICEHCINMLESRRTQQMNQVIQPTISKLYFKLREIKSQIQPAVELYQKMYMSLTAGDSTYQLQDAQALRGSIAKQAETLDATSKSIATLPADLESPRFIHLQNTIRRATSQYIKDYLLTLPVLPNFAELEKIKQERARSMEIPEPSHVNIKRVTVTTGWSPANVGNDETSEDPLIQQMNIVKNYIDQARTAQRFEEVVSLEENFKMLREMHHRQSQENFKS